jgi:Kef-type K+ transport system membrane component KefB
MTALSSIDRLAVALLGGTILLALSPPSTIAIIKEVKAQGAFTSTVLGVTIAMDIVIIVLFAVVIRIAAAILTGAEFSVVFAVVLMINLVLTLAVGVAVGSVIRGISILQRHDILQMALIVCLSYGIFAGTRFAVTLTHGRWLELHVEPLLIALTAGVYVVNYTPFSRQFDTLLHRLSPPTYVVFFTLTGLMIKLNILMAMLPVALVLFTVRFATINMGSYVGSRLTNQSQLTARYAGLALITQAGIALGLARNVANTLPMLGDTFTTMVVSVIILNELFGPLFLKLALRKVGESHSAEIAPSHTVSVISTPDSANVV